jgi:hypothetical protein
MILMVKDTAKWRNVGIDILCLILIYKKNKEKSEETQLLGGEEMGTPRTFGGIPHWSCKSWWRRMGSDPNFPTKLWPDIFDSGWASAG